MKCPRCDGMLRALDSKTIEKEGKTFRVIKLYCLKNGCPANNGEPVHTDEIEVTNNGND